jgi:hypothetical protein
MASEQAIVLFAALAFYLLRFLDEESGPTPTARRPSERQSSIALTSIVERMDRPEHHRVVPSA